MVFAEDMRPYTAELGWCATDINKRDFDGKIS